MNAQSPSTERGITFTKYDAISRILVIGSLPSNYGFSSLDPDLNYNADQSLPHFENMETGTANFVVVNMYDGFVASGVFANTSFYYGSSLKNLQGRLAATAFRDKSGHTDITRIPIKYLL